MTAKPSSRPRRELTDEQKEAAAERRAELCARSAPIQMGRQLGILPWCYFNTTNAGLQFLYASEQKQVVWHTLHDWRKLGYRVQKGQKGFPIWSAPQSSGESDEGEGGEEGGSSREYFRLCYLFHLGQVEPIPDATLSKLSPTIDVEAIQRALDAMMADALVPTEDAEDPQLVA